MAKYDLLGVNLTDTLNVSGLAAGATSGTLTTGSFGSPTGTQLLVVDYDVPAKIEVISATIAGTALTSITRALSGTADVTHAASAKVLHTLTPTHWANLQPIAAADAWTSWTPTWTNLTVGNGTVSAKYIKIGRFVRFQIVLIFGSTTSISGSVSLSFPITAVDPGDSGGIHPLGQVTLSDNGTAQYDAVLKFSTTSLAVIKGKTVSGSDLRNDTDLSSTSPFTWVTNDALHINGAYESAS